MLPMLPNFNKLMGRFKATPIKTIDPNVYTGRWPLLEHAQKGDLITVNNLLSDGADPWVEPISPAGVQELYGSSCKDPRDLLFFACLHGWQKIVLKLLHQKPEKINKIYMCRWDQHRTPLTIALEK